MPNVWQRQSDGLWVAQVSIGPRGARKTHRRYSASKEEAEAKLAELIVELSPTTTADRFWAKVDRSGDCWLWMGKRIVKYGYFNHRRAHRVAWELTHGDIPKGLYVLHSCDNPPCVNPAHLRLGTQFDNMADMHDRGRGRWHRPEAV